LKSRDLHLDKPGYQAFFLSPSSLVLRLLITMFATKQSIKTVASNARAFSTTPARRSYDDTIKNLLIG
jgi:hypothetical protein